MRVTWVVDSFEVKENGLREGSAGNALGGIEGR